MNKKKCILSCAFLVGLCLLLAGVSRLLEYKGSREKIAPFYRHAVGIDVLFLGDSHACSDIYPLELWRDYGIASYNLASYNLSVPASYWVMRNALLACHPKLIVLDVNQIWLQEKLNESSNDLHTGLDGFPLNLTKLETILDLMDDPQLTDKDGQRFSDLRAEFLFPFIKYHARWSDLNEEDLHPNYDRELGGERNIGVAKPDAYEITPDAAEESGFGFVYLRRILDFCRDAGIRVLLTNLPYPCRNSNDEQLYTNAVASVAEEYGVEYVDFVFLDKVVDYGTDCYDPGSHLNPSGAWKVTDYLGEHLSEAYGMPDHRGEDAYASWEAEYAVYEEMKLQSLSREPDPYSYLMLLSDPSFSAVILIPEGSEAYSDERAMRLLQNAGRRHLMAADNEEAVWSDYLMPLEQVGNAPDRAWLAVIDRGSAAVLECSGSGALATSFGSVTLASGTVTVTGASGSVTLTRQQPGTDLHTAVLDSRTGEVLYEHSVRL